MCGGHIDRLCDAWRARGFVFLSTVCTRLFWWVRIESDHINEEAGGVLGMIEDVHIESGTYAVQRTL